MTRRAELLEKNAAKAVQLSLDSDGLTLLCSDVCVSSGKSMGAAEKIISPAQAQLRVPNTCPEVSGVALLDIAQLLERILEESSTLKPP